MVGTTMAVITTAGIAIMGDTITAVTVMADITTRGTAVGTAVGIGADTVTGTTSSDLFLTEPASSRSRKC